jgi:hypothetical protein
MAKKPIITGKELRKNYGIFGLSIIQIVSLIFILALIATIVYQVV